MNFNLVRQERIAKLEAKLGRINNALKNYRYIKPAQYLEDLAAFEATEKEIEIQLLYKTHEQ